MENSKNSDDAEKLLMSQAIKGDTRAVGVLYDRYLNLVYNYVYYRVGNTRETEFVTEKIFMKVFENLHKYLKNNKDKPFPVWLFKTARQEIMLFQKQHAFVNHFADENYLDPTQEELVRVLRRLDEKDYQFIIARFFNGLNDNAISTVMDFDIHKMNNMQLQALQTIERLMGKGTQNE